MNDAHIYCTEEQIKDEFIAVMEMHAEVYEILGLDNYTVRFSTGTPSDPKGKEKYVDNPQAWAESERILARCLQERGINYVEVQGEAAFYGPKIDIQFRPSPAARRPSSTIQLDFAVPARLGLTYIGADNAEHTPYVIHRAPLGTHERFVAFLIEHFGGAFPTWLAPVQVRVITVSEQYEAYGRSIVDRLRKQMVRAELATQSETVSKKIREGTTRKIPLLLIVGEREQADGTVTLRRYGQTQQHTMSVADFEAALRRAIEQRTLDFAV